MQHWGLKRSCRAWAKPMREKTQVKKNEKWRRCVNKKYTQVTKTSFFYQIRYLFYKPNESSGTCSHVVQPNTYSTGSTLSALSVLHSLAHPVGQTMSVDHRGVCCWVCVYEMLLVLSGLFTPPGGHSLYHNTCWPLGRPEGMTHALNA